MIMDISPTRMELLRLKHKETIAVKGHKLLKDKLDELIRIMLSVVRDIARLRSEVDEAMNGYRVMMALAEQATFPAAARSALICSGRSIEIDVADRSLLNLRVPVYRVRLGGDPAVGYGPAQTSAALDQAQMRFMDGVKKQVALAEKEKTVQVLGSEIIRTRRRVNALEYILIPDIRDTLTYITMKLDEQERNTRVQLMRIKEVIRAPLSPTTAFPGSVKSNV